MKQNEPNADILKLLGNLKESCKLLTGDQPDEVIEDATVLALRMFLDQDIVMLKHLTSLRQTFGSVTSSTANKICQVSTVFTVVFIINYFSSICFEPLS